MQIKRVSQVNKLLFNPMHTINFIQKKNLKAIFTSAGRKSSQNGTYDVRREERIDFKIEKPPYISLGRACVKAGRVLTRRQ